MLKKQLQTYQWRALLLLFVGVVVVQTRTASSAHSTATSTLIRPSTVGCAASIWNWPCWASLFEEQQGTVAAAVQATLSGLSGVYFEWKLKADDSFSLWDRNMQLGMYAILFNLLSLVLSPSDWASLWPPSFFHDFSLPALSVVLLTASGGLLVAVTVRYTDNIVKNFATSVAIILTAGLSYVLLHDTEVDTNFVAGTTTVVCAVLLYNDNAASRRDSAAAAGGGERQESAAAC